LRNQAVVEERSFSSVVVIDGAVVILILPARVLMFVILYAGVLFSSKLMYHGESEKKARRKMCVHDIILSFLLVCAHNPLFVRSLAARVTNWLLQKCHEKCTEKHQRAFFPYACVCRASGNKSRLCSTLHAPNMTKNQKRKTQRNIHRINSTFIQFFFSSRSFSCERAVSERERRENHFEVTHSGLCVVAQAE
jgi:hypothetical protein